MSRYKRPLTPDEIASVDDREIDFSDIPELDAAFWREAELVRPDRTERITLRVKRSVLDHFRAPGRGYQTRINRVLESYVKAQRGSEGR
ncbi:MAG: BrnA antitoxin family protein [Rhodospirillaceae bacterium]|nr:BrnA antitoxin family protein [Rhodospirillaceae bacterium]MYJ72371.1 BrnA antitoxin family protein [Rhodospirillaceae bacterium]